MSEMSDLILHAYDFSPFAEKVRLTMGLKKLRWHAVDAPIWPPRPAQEPLSAGYRRIPMLQIGADVFCDTKLILREIDRRHPAPSLYPGGYGRVAVLAAWADATFFMAGASIATSIMGDQVPAEMLEDRIRFMKHDFSREASERALPINRQRVAAGMVLLADMLADGRPFLMGDDLSAADLAAYHALAFTRQHGGAQAEALLPFEPLLPWLARVGGQGHGDRVEMAPEEAFAVARAATPMPTGGVAPDDPAGLPAETEVVLQTEEPGDPIRGTLVAANPDRITIRHRSDEAGTVHVHFPRLGYAVLPA